MAGGRAGDYVKFAGHFEKERGGKEEGEVEVEVEGRGYNRNYYAFIYLDAFSYVLVLLLFIYFLSFFLRVPSLGVNVTVSN